MRHFISFAPNYQAIWAAWSVKGHTLGHRYNGWGSTSPFQAKVQISKVLDGAPIEQEQKWQSYVIPNVARSYVDYTGEVRTIPDQQIEDAIVTQIGFEMEKGHWAKAATNEELEERWSSPSKKTSRIGSHHPRIAQPPSLRITMSKNAGWSVKANILNFSPTK